MSFLTSGARRTTGLRGEVERRLPERRRIAHLRHAARVPRVAFLVTAACLSAAGVASLFNDRTTSSPPAPRHVGDGDLELEAFAQEFTRAYLAWGGAQPVRRAALARFLPSDADPDAGVNVPADRSNRVLWTSVVRDAPQGPHRDITVAADTSGGIVFLALELDHSSRSGVRLVDYPALVGGAPVDQSQELPSGEPVDDPGLEATARRALSNFVAARRDALAADLAPGSFVSLPPQPMALRAVDAVGWTRPNREVALLVHARREDGVELTLRYRLGVVRRAGRWFVQSIGA